MNNYFFKIVYHERPVEGTNKSTLEPIQLGMVKISTLSQEEIPETKSFWFNDFDLYAIQKNKELWNKIFGPHVPVDYVERWIERKGKSTTEIRDSITDFLFSDPNPKLWGHHAAPDWVILNQIYGGIGQLDPALYQEVEPYAGEFPPTTSSDALQQAYWAKEYFLS